MGDVGKSPHVQSRQQALAIAYATQRRGRANGGLVPGYDLGGGVMNPAGMIGMPTPAMGPPTNIGGIAGAGIAPQMGPPPPSPNPAVSATTANPAITPSAAPMPTGIAQNTMPTPTGMVPAGVNPGGPPAVNNPIARPLMATGGALHRASGGFNMASSPHLSPGWQAKSEIKGMMHGPILSNVPGRTDNHAARVPSGSYVLPASHISSMGQGNSVAGLSAAHSMFGSGGPYGAGVTKLGHGHGAPSIKPPSAGKFSTGGRLWPSTHGSSVLSLPMFNRSEGGPRGHGNHTPVDVMLSGGEYVIHPDVVRAIGKGSLKNGHAVLDAYVMHARKKEIETQRKLPPPAKK